MRGIKKACRNGMQDYSILIYSSSSSSSSFSGGDFEGTAPGPALYHLPAAAASLEEPGKPRVSDLKSSVSAGHANQPPNKAAGAPQGAVVLFAVNKLKALREHIRENEECYA